MLMAAGTTRLSDLIVPEIFASYTQQLTTEKSRLITSGAVQRNSYLDSFLAGPGLTINVPDFKDLDDDAENVSTDDPTVLSSPNKIGTGMEIAVRCSRNQSWSSMSLNPDLIGPDPMDAIANRVAAYWVRRQQTAFVAEMNGLFANNATATDAYHVQNDMVHDVSSTAFTDGVTNFSAENFIDAALTMGDSMDDLSMMMVHSVVYGRMQKNNLIDFIPDARGEINIPTFLGREVIVDDGMPNTGGVFDTWLFGEGAVLMGEGTPVMPVEIWRNPAAGNGSGEEILYNRKSWSMHAVGNAYIGTAPNGGPSNANTANNLANAASWRRAYAERKMIKVARLVTREF
jgi:hypothetical protein